MLVLSRKIGETIRVGSELELVVLAVNRGRVKLGFAGPRDIRIRRGEFENEAPLSAEAGVPAGASVVTEPPSRCGIETESRAGLAPLRAFRVASGV